MTNNRIIRIDSIRRAVSFERGQRQFVVCPTNASFKRLQAVLRAEQWNCTVHPDFAFLAVYSRQAVPA